MSNLTESAKEEIDGMEYEEMLTLYRYSQVGATMFIGDTGSYFIDRMKARKDALPQGMDVIISKRVGFS